MFYVKSNPKIYLYFFSKLLYPKFTCNSIIKKCRCSYKSFNNITLSDIDISKTAANETYSVVRTATGNLILSSKPNFLESLMPLPQEKCLSFQPLARILSQNVKQYLADPQSYSTYCYTFKKVRHFSKNLMEKVPFITARSDDKFLNIQRNVQWLPRYFNTNSKYQFSDSGSTKNDSYDKPQSVDKTPSIENGDYRKVRKLLDVLTADQRMEILSDLQYEEALERRRAAEEKLASWHWRSKFGRPTSVQPSTVDASGTYCEIPHDWLMKKVESPSDLPPTLSALRDVAVFNALPFVGFGFLDNVIMIVAGDYIDLTIGTYLGISTMAAAALGNTISDLAGIGSAWYVEFLTSKVGMRHPELTHEQQQMSSTRWSANIGRGIGVVIGCLLGMFPLMFLSDRGKKHEEEEEGEGEQNTLKGMQPKEKKEKGDR